MQLRRKSNGAPVLLGPVLGKGGEGSVFPVRNSPDLVAKIYSKPPTPTKVEKLQAMTRVRSPAILRVAAWPVDLLEDEKRVVRGFLMPKVTSREDVHELYTPKSRRRAFPEADFRFVVRAAANMARAFAVVHAEGHVLGDVNHGNALVGGDGTVMLIDCDSFQIRSGGKVFTCDVGVPLFTPPELQGRVFRGLRRMSNHDGFGLAVLIFHLLFLGRHPYAGRYESGDMPIEQAIAEARFAYGSASASLGVSAPPGTLPLDTFGARVADLFERAFESPTASVRPSAMEWIEGLTELEGHLEPCAESRFHFHPRSRPCCWCEIDNRTHGRAFGPQTAIAELLSEDAVRELWAEIAKVARPHRWTLPKGARDSATFPRLGERHRSLIFVSWAFVAMGCAALLSEPGEHILEAVACIVSAVVIRLGNGWRSFGLVRAVARRELRLAEEHWKGVLETWNNECSLEGFDRIRSQLKEMWEGLSTLQAAKRTRLAKVARERAMSQAGRYLAQFRIADASFQVVSPRELRILAKNSITTAAQVALASGLPRNLVSDDKVSRAAEYELIRWCRALADGFPLDPADPQDAAEIANVEKWAAERQQTLVAGLRKGPALLERKRLEMREARDRLEPAVDAAWKSLRAARRKAGLSDPGEKA
jgi:DNA-binding helix-hairpin-helix protein with protein kinase domain